MKAELPSHAFEITVPVQAADIDQQKHVNNTVYLRWVQEVATAHWEALAPLAAREVITWVVLRCAAPRMPSPPRRRGHFT